MKVLHVYSGNLFGGIEILLLTLARFRGLVPDLVPSFALCFEGQLSHGLAEAGVPAKILGEVRFSRPWTLFRARRRLAALIRKEKPDVVICHAPWSQALFGGVIRKRGVRSYFWQHDAFKKTHWIEFIAKWFPPTGIISNSRYAQGTLSKIYPGVPSQVVYCAVAPFDRSQAGEFRAEIRKELGISEQTVVIVQASRLERYKGQTLHLETLARIKDVPDWISLQVGGAQRPHEAVFEKELCALARDLEITDRIRFLGQRSDVLKIFAASDIHFQPNSEPEPFGIAFIEALSAGLPILTTAMGGALEIVTPECGFVVPPQDMQNLAKRLRDLVLDKNLRRKLGQNGPSRAKELCDPERQIKVLYEALK